MPQVGAVPLVSTLVIAAMPRAVRFAREHVVTALSAWELDGDVVQVAKLLASELVTNAVNASVGDTWATEPGNSARVAIRLHLPGDMLRIAVWDGNTRAPVLTAATPESDCGRGLQLVAALAKQWGCHPSWDGKVVWCDIGTGG